MIVLFQGGLLDGEFSNFLSDKKEVRVLSREGDVSLYNVGDTSKEVGYTLAVAHFSGIIQSADSLIDLKEVDFYGEG